MKKQIEGYLSKKHKELYAGLRLHLRDTKVKLAKIKNTFLSKKDGSKWEIETTLRRIDPDE